MSERKPIGLTTPHRKPEQPAGEHSLATQAAINAKLEVMARKCEQMPFGDTAASFAAWIRGHKL